MQCSTKSESIYPTQVKVIRLRYITIPSASPQEVVLFTYGKNYPIDDIIWSIMHILHIHQVQQFRKKCIFYYINNNNNNDKNVSTSYIVIFNIHEVHYKPFHSPLPKYIIPVTYNSMPKPYLHHMPPYYDIFSNQ